MSDAEGAHGDPERGPESVHALGEAAVTQVSRIPSAEARETPSEGPGKEAAGGAAGIGDGAAGGAAGEPRSQGPQGPQEGRDDQEGQDDQEYSYSYSESDSEPSPAGEARAAGRSRPGDTATESALGITAEPTVGPSAGPPFGPPLGPAADPAGGDPARGRAAPSRLVAAAARSPPYGAGHRNPVSPRDLADRTRALSPLAAQSRTVDSLTESTGGDSESSSGGASQGASGGDSDGVSNCVSDGVSERGSGGPAGPGEGSSSGSNPAAGRPSSRPSPRPSPLHFAPSDTGRVREKRPAFKFLNSKNFDWFTFRSEVGGMKGLLSSYLDRPEMAGLQKQATQPVRDLRNHKYSIYESSESSYKPSTLEYGVPSAVPSQKSEAQVPPILRASPLIRGSSPAAGAAARARLALFTLLQIAKLTLVVLSFALPSVFGSRVGVGLISFYVLAEILVTDLVSAHASLSYLAAQTEIRSLIFDASSTLASAVPRTLLSECGHAKFLRRQRRLSVASVLSQVVCNLLGLAALAAPMEFFLGELLFPGAEAPQLTAMAAKVMLAVAGVLSCFLYYFAARSSSQALDSRLYCHRSLACNLRGFYPSCAFALDFTDAHMYNEGLCYFFTEEGPKMFVPFLAIVTAELRLEPIDVRLKIRFSRGELATMDGRKDPKVSAAHSRGYDAVEYQDFQAWIVLGLSNQVKLWLPLSLTQYRPTMFGLQGEELATLLDVASSALRLETDENEKLQANLRRLAQFCRYYQEERRSSVAEEGMHMERLERLVLPSETE